MSLTFIVSYFHPKYTDDTRKIDSDRDSQKSTKKSVVPPIDSLLGGATLTLFYLSLDFIQTYHTDLINIYINYVDYVKDSNKQLLCAKNYLLASIIFLYSHYY